MNSLAQTPPPSSIDVREQLRQQERQQVLRQQQERSVRNTQKTMQQTRLGTVPRHEQPCVTIKHIELDGELSNQFRWALRAANQSDDGKRDQAIPGCLGAKGINLVMRRIQNAIAKKGFVTTKILAKQQDFSDDVLHLTLFLGRVNQIRLADGVSDQATLWNVVPIKHGDVVNIRHIEQALENFRRLPSSSADITIAASDSPTAQPGSSDLLIHWQQTRPYRFNFWIDNSGSRSTGIYQAGGTLSIDHLMQANDLFYVSGNHDLGGGESGDRGTYGYTVHYSIPWGYWLIAFTASSNHYFQTIAAVEPYSYSGDGDNYELKLSRLIYRNAHRDVSFSISGWHRTSKNFIEDTEIEVQRRRMAGYELGLNYTEYIQAATLDLGLSFRQGTGALNSLPAPEESIGEGTSRGQIITFSAYLHVPFSVGEQRLRYSGTLRAQMNTTRLIPQDRFSIGSRYTVRGFDGELQLSGDRGWLLRNDLGLILGPSRQELYIGIDTGRVAGPSAVTLVGRQLTGAVIGLRGGYKGFSYDLFYGGPLAKPTGFATSSPVAGFSLSWSI